MGSTSRRNKIKGTPASRTFKKPVCSKGHDANRTVHEREGWICLDCYDEFVADLPGIRETSRGGVILPTGVRNPTAPKTRDYMPNRRARRSYR